MQVRDDSPHPVRGVVFMGMGEPFLNYDRVMRAADVLSESCGVAINARAITISTVGIVPMIRRFTAERRPHRLVVSLTSADPERRRELLPVEAVAPAAGADGGGARIPGGDRRARDAGVDAVWPASTRGRRTPGGWRS